MSKILHIVSSMDPQGGGVAEAIRLLIIGMINENVPCDVLSLDDPNSPFLANNKFRIYACGPGKTGWKYAKKFDIWLSENISNYSHIIVHGLWQYHTYSVFKSIAHFPKKIPVYVFPHGMLDPYFQKAKGRKLKAIRNIIFWHLFEKKLINNCSGLIFTSIEEERLAQQTFSDYHPKSALVSPLGIETPQFQSAPNTYGNNYWLFLGRIHPKKGIDLLIEAYLLLSKKHKLPNLVIAGPGWDTPFGLELKNEIGGNANIYAEDMVTGDYKWNLINNSDLFILPSHQENFGISIVEALACGIVPLITDKVNIYEEISTNHAGLVAKDNINSILNTLKYWTELEPNEKKHLKENAHKLFVTKFSLEKATLNLLDKMHVNGAQ